MRDGLAALPDIGEVCGAGLSIGVTLASRVVNAMRDHGVLISATGPHGDTLKIRPPLVFEEEHADLLIGTLARCLMDATA